MAQLQVLWVILHVAVVRLLLSLVSTTQKPVGLTADPYISVE
jgi:hypothetical protein